MNESKNEQSYSRKPFHLPSRERARFLLNVTTDSKLGVMFIAGAVMALRQLGLLSLVHVFCGTGMGNIVLTSLADAFRRVPKRIYRDNSLNKQERTEFAWRALLLPPATSEHDVLAHYFFDYVTRWCLYNHEYDMYHSRVCSVPTNWATPWAAELAHQFKNTNIDIAVESICNSRVRPRDITWHRPNFLLCASEAGTSVSVCYTNDPQASQVGVFGTDFVRPGCVSSASEFVAASVCGAALSSPHSLRINNVMVAVQSGLSVDPLGMRASGVYYIQEKLGTLPRMENIQPDLGGSPELCVSQKLILIDAFTYSKSYFHESDIGVRSICTTDRDLLMSAPDTKHERPIAFNRQLVTMYDPCRLLGPECDTTNNRKLFLRAVEESTFADEGLCGSDPVLAFHAANLGFIETLYAFGTHEQRVSLKQSFRPLCPHVSDEFDFFHQVFGVPPPVQSAETKQSQSNVTTQPPPESVHDE
jgi:hypothetical protein